ncbi:MAG TPA: ATP-binding protein [Nitriliruptorales bacterium]|nr:ATP-binding protein [Nitriliruptorales bacterium]
MQQLLGALHNAQVLAFAALAIVALWQWRSRGGRPVMWLAATFSTLAFVVVMGRAIPDDAPLWAQRLNVLVLALFPYALYRFMRSFVVVARWVDRGVHAALGLVAVWTVGMFDPGRQGSAAFVVFAYGFLAYWSVLSGMTAVGLWRAGRGQPNLVRDRMWLLSLGALALNLALFVAVSAGTTAGGNSAGAQLLTSSAALLAALFFYLGFAPPAALRAIWRRPAERALREAQLHLVSSVSPEDVGSALLPFLEQVFGVNGAVLADRDGRVIAVQGMQAEEAQRLIVALSANDPPEGDVVRLRLRSGLLAVRVGPATPYFGRDELELVESLGSFIDLALERAELHNRELEARRQVERANAELEALVYGISHDLKNPIITLLGYADIVRAEYGDRLDDEGRHFLERMAASANYMGNLLTDLLELSRVGRVKMEPAELDLGGLVEDVAEEVRRSHPAVTVQVSALPCVLVNPVRARQLFTNLLTNAVRHGGRTDITIRVGATTSNDGGASVTVADDGRGIPPQYRERAFGIFERLDQGGATPEGTGIGLAICRRIVETFDGDIQIADAPVGTTFRIDLPPTAIVSFPSAAAAEPPG